MSFEREKESGSFVVARVGSQRIALPGECVSELISSPVVHSFPHTTPLITGVVVRRGHILPVLDLCPKLSGQPSSSTRFFLVVERRMRGEVERCAIPVQGECELISAVLNPCEENGCAIGFINVSGERIDVLGLERTIAAGAGAVDSPLAGISS